MSGFSFGSSLTQSSSPSPLFASSSASTSPFLGSSFSTYTFGAPSSLPLFRSSSSPTFGAPLSSPLFGTSAASSSPLFRTQSGLFGASSSSSIAATTQSSSPSPLFASSSASTSPFFGSSFSTTTASAFGGFGVSSPASMTTGFAASSSSGAAGTTTTTYFGGFGVSSPASTTTGSSSSTAATTASLSPSFGASSSAAVSTPSLSSSTAPSSSSTPTSISSPSFSAGSAASSSSGAASSASFPGFDGSNAAAVSSSAAGITTTSFGGFGVSSPASTTRQPSVSPVFSRRQSRRRSRPCFGGHFNAAQPSSSSTPSTSISSPSYSISFQNISDVLANLCSSLESLPEGFVRRAEWMETGEEWTKPAHQGNLPSDPVPQVAFTSFASDFARLGRNLAVVMGLGSHYQTEVLNLRNQLAEADSARKEWMAKAEDADDKRALAETRERLVGAELELVRTQMEGFMGELASMRAQLDERLRRAQEAEKAKFEAQVVLEVERAARLASEEAWAQEAKEARLRFKEFKREAKKASKFRWTHAEQFAIGMLEKVITSVHPDYSIDWDAIIAAYNARIDGANQPGPDGVDEVKALMNEIIEDLDVDPEAFLVKDDGYGSDLPDRPTA